MLSSAGRAQREVNDLTAQLQGRRLELETDPVQRFRTADTAQQAVGEIFRSRNPATAMARVRERIGTDQRALEGLRAAVRDHLQERIRTSVPTGEPSTETVRASLAQTDRFLRQNRPILQQLYTPEEMRYLDRAWNLTRDAARDNLRVSAGSQTQPRMLQEAANTAFETMLRLRYGLLRGGGISRITRQLRDLLRRTQGRMTDQQAIEVTLDEAMLDPQLARQLLERQVEIPPEMLTRRGVRAAPLSAAVQGLEQETSE